MATRKVAGVPIIVRGIMTLAQAGIRHITLLIAGTQREKIERFLLRYERQPLPELEIIDYDEPYRMSPDIVGRVASGIGPRCTIIDANLLFEKELVGAVRAARAENGEVILCREGVHPLPIVDVSRAAWERLAAFTAERPRSIESCLRHLAEGEAPRIAQKPAAMNTFLVRRHRDLLVAEKFLTESIRHATSGPVAKYINKRLSLPASLLLSKLWVSPNAITAFNIIVGVFSGVFAADGHRYDVILLGAVLFQLASIIDGCDGEVAKLTFRASKFGQYADSLSDNLSLGSFMTGLIAGYWRSTHSHVAFSVGAVMIFSTAVTLFWMVRYLRRNTQSASLVTFDEEYLQKLSGQPRWLLLFIRYGKVLLKKDVFSFAFLLFAIAGVLYWWLFIAAFGTAVAAIILTSLNLRELTAHRARPVLVFDFDGTIVNSMEAFADIAARVMPRRLPVDAATARRLYLETSGLPFFQQLEVLFPGHAANAATAEEFEREKLEGYFDEPLFDDAAETIACLRRRGIRVAVSSNNFQELVDRFVGQSGIAFDLVCGFRERFAKGADHFAHIEERLGAKRSEIAFVGDSLKDGERAADYGITFIAKAGIFTREQFAKRFPSARVIGTLSELKGMFS